MNGITVTFGRVAKINALISFLSTLVLRLYVNNRGTPLVTDTAANYTEATFTGYAALNLTSWGTAFLNANNQGEVDEILRTFTRTSTGTVQTVYGYYLTDGSGNLVDVQQGLAGGVPITNAGDGYAVVPREVVGSLTTP